MTRVTIVIPPVLRRLFAGQSQMDVFARTLREALASFAADAGPAGDRMMQADGTMQRFVRVFVDGRPARSRAELDAELPEGARVSILLALAGG